MESKKTPVLGSPTRRKKRHPERSASQICRVTQRLEARSRRTSRGALILPMLFGAFQPPKPASGGPATVFHRGPPVQGGSCPQRPAAGFLGLRLTLRLGVAPFPLRGSDSMTLRIQ